MHIFPRKFPRKQILLYLFVLGLSTSSCAPQRRYDPIAERVRVDRIVEQVHVGDSRKQVEQVLGRPYSTELDGRDTILTYVTGPEHAAADLQAAQRTANNIGLLTGILTAAGSVGGGSLGNAGAIGSQALSVGGSLSGGQAAHLDTSEQTTIRVRIHSNKVKSIDTEDSGRVGIGAER